MGDAPDISVSPAEIGQRLPGVRDGAHHIAARSEGNVGHLGRSWSSGAFRGHGGGKISLGGSGKFDEIWMT